MTLVIDVTVESEQWSQSGDLESIARQAIDGAVAETAPSLRSGAEVSLLFCDDARMRELNSAWRGLDKPTNVLSFPASHPDARASAPLLGDIAIAFETVARESREENKSMLDHVSHMIVHGFLHLLGYDHESSADAEEMEAVERRALARVGISDPYAASVPRGDAEG